MRVSQVVKGEMSAKTTYQKSAKGPVSIAECAADGKSVTLENVGRKVSLFLIQGVTLAGLIVSAVLRPCCFVPNALFGSTLYAGLFNYLCRRQKLYKLPCHGVCLTVNRILQKVLN